MNRLIIITGLSGSGKSLAIRAFEDMGYFCVDNLPVQLIPTFSELISKSREEIQRAALVIDIREGAFLTEFPRIINELRQSGIRMNIIFFEASLEVLKRRFSETRRPHPLAQDATLDQGIEREIEIMRPIREFADSVIDTSRFNVHEFRQFLKNSFEPADSSRININIISFGYKYSIPSESDLVFDVRFVPNPFFVETLKLKTGLDREVVTFIESYQEYSDFLRMIRDLMIFLIPKFIQEGKSYLTLAIGCTGGKHRSVAAVEALKSLLEKCGYQPRLIHRDIAKG